MNEKIVISTCGKRGASLLIRVVMIMNGFITSHSSFVSPVHSVYKQLNVILVSVQCYNMLNYSCTLLNIAPEYEMVLHVPTRSQTLFFLSLAGFKS